MSRPPLEVADLIRTAGAAFIERNHQWLGWKHIKVLLAIARYRTAALWDTFVGDRQNQCSCLASSASSRASMRPSSFPTPSLFGVLRF